MLKSEDIKIILGIETSCDETGCAIGLKDQNRIKILSNIVASSAPLQEKYGGVFPEAAAREQIKSIIPVIKEALSQARVRSYQIDAIAVTYGPGLIGSLLVGVEAAKTLALLWNKPLISINHLLAHFYAIWITNDPSSPFKAGQNKLSASESDASPNFPLIGLLVSGGHTDLILMKKHGKYQYLGGTRDDAAGECFDKCARLLNLPYPGGPNLSKLARKGDDKAFNLPLPMINSQDFDFSFSGLKTAVANLITNRIADTTGRSSADLAAAIEHSITEVIVRKTIAAAKKYQVEQIIASGGVVANTTLRTKLSLATKQFLTHGKLYIPLISLCTDNAAVVTACAFYNLNFVDPLKLQANPGISLSNLD